ncbi:unnamed protein product [Cuscuta epithymum]|uniref:RNA polymerase II C-terminal domain phosphatase-like n=1 Tax=Cuscuta epithymum TaxID=186058 RepID=A0AAV0C474_9ASTE|nr:unnamed protein product [Cuscuta epithymum]CAH9147193.1 unnamed protein product [Cuscuta epithymum]
MSLTAESPAHSSSSDDFAAFLDAELDSDDLEEEEADQEERDDGKQDENNDLGEDGDCNDISDANRVKRRKLENCKGTGDKECSKSCEESGGTLGVSVKIDLCIHPGVIGGMCIRCGQLMDNESGVSFGYIHKNLRLTSDEVARLREKDLKNLLQHKKLYLVLDLDHTLLNSTRLSDISPEEEYLKDAPPDALQSSLFRLDMIHMMTKLRPYVHKFLKEASDLFEMYIYTMGERPYALEMAKLLDPRGVYFQSKVIAQGDSTQRHQKGLDIVLGQENSVLILDDTEAVWGKHRENLIVVERYHFFASSCKQFGFNCESHSQRKVDESEEEGALVTILKILKQIHTIFFDQDQGDNMRKGDVREVLKEVRKEVLKGCKVVFSRVFPNNIQAEKHQLWRMAEQLGATCATKVDESVTHVVSTDAGTDKSRWAKQHKKFLVHPKWIEAANYRWEKKPEKDFQLGMPHISQS